jgi:rfaE bifunctional protein nucleotidyltransferase chain/domain
VSHREAAPIMDPEDLARELEAVRRRDECTVALANGCFDLLHPGHVNFLEGAAAEADLLVVGINADETVRELKGHGRPIMPADERARVVAALGVVDYATVFVEPTADRLIELLRPDVHCKGTDYAAGVPEEATARRVGARVALVGGPKIQNTSNILEDIRGED